MARERESHDRLTTGPDPFSDSFEDAASSPGQVQVIHGVYSHSLPLAGMTVAAARADLQERMNVPADAMAVIDGDEAGDDTILQEGQMLNFVKRMGERGSVAFSSRRGRFRSSC